MIINTTFKGINEKLEFDGSNFQISKRENKDFEKTIDPLNGNEIIINRYQTIVSACWTLEWIKRRKISLSKDVLEFINLSASEENKIIELIECIIEPRSKQYFSNILLKGKGPNILKLKDILRTLNEKRLSLVMKNSGYFYIFSPDLTEKFEIKTKSDGYYTSTTPGLWFNEPRNEVCISNKWMIEFRKAIKKLSNA